MHAGLTRLLRAQPATGDRRIQRVWIRCGVLDPFFGFTWYREICMMCKLLKASMLALLAGTALADVRDNSLLRENSLRLQALLSEQPEIEFDPASLLVRFDASQSAEDIDFTISLGGGRVIERYSIVPGLVHATLDGISVQDAIDLFQQLPGVEYAEPDYIVRASVIPNDPGFGNLWGMNRTNDADIDAPEGWDIFRGNANFPVGVIDTGVQYTHPDLAANIWTNPGEIAGNGIDDDGNGFIDDTRGWDFVNNDNNPMDDNGHGTHCAGTIGGVGNNGIGVVGVMWTTKIVPLKFLGANGSGSITAALGCLQYATGKGIKVSSNSWGGGGYSQSFFNAIESSKAIGHIFVAAAGNSGTNNDTTPSYPASYTNDNVIAVASTTNTDAMSSFSQYGLTSVDIGAPGSSIYSTYPTNSYATLSGTSMATPHVAGVVTSVYGQNTSWTYTQVRSRVLSTARPIAALNGRCVTGGVVNLAAALVNNNSTPTISVTSPANGLVVAAGTAVSLSGTANDTQDGNITANIQWSSNLQGALGTGGSVNAATLAPGTHTITATVADSGGLTASATRSVTVNAVAGTVPGGPSGVRVYRVNGIANVTWIDNSANEWGFQVERQRSVGGVWGSDTIVGGTAANVTALLNAPPATGATWRYRVRAFNGAGYSTWSAYSIFGN